MAVIMLSTITQIMAVKVNNVDHVRSIINPLNYARSQLISLYIVLQKDRYTW